MIKKNVKHPRKEKKCVAWAKEDVSFLETTTEKEKTHRVPRCAALRPTLSDRQECEAV